MKEARKMEKYAKRIFLTGNLKYLILSLIERDGAATGYRIMRRIQDMGINLDAGSLYNSINSLEEKKLVKKNPTEKRHTFEYTITENGKEFLTHYRELVQKVNVGLKP